MGPFVAVKIHVSGLATRKEDETPYGWASGSSFLLLEVTGQWYVVAGDRWIT
jgi:hypothetical protein